SDSWGFFNDPWASSAYNVTINDNTIVLDAADLAYGISAISLYPYDEDNEKIVKDMVISGNDVTITTQTEGVGISASSNDVSITDNKVTLNAGHSPVQAYTDGYIGNVSYGIFVNNFNKDMGNFVNNTVTGNTIVSNVQAINAAKDGDEVQPLTIEDNEASTSYLIDDDSYATYFNADGTIKDDAPISAGDVLLLGDLTGKKLVIDTPLTIRGVPNKKLVNCTIKLIEGADGTVIDGLTIEYPELKYGAITLEEVNNVEITNNKIIVPSTTQTVYGIAINSGTNGCNNISINNNHINITGSKYVYGIDIWQDYSLENKHNNIMIFENEFFVTGTGGKMTEGIFVSNCNDVIIDGNDITATCDGPAYGIGTNYLFNAAIANNHITVGSDNMAYGITATTSGSDLIIRANEIDVVGVGAVGVGINNQTGAIIEDNTISIDGGNYTTITVSDSLGTANAGILVGEGNTDVKTSGNDVSEKTPLRSDTAIEANNITVTAAPSGNGSFEITLRTAGGMPLANQVVKVVFNNQMYELTTDAKGVALLPFALNKGGIYNVEVFYLGDDDYRGSDASAKLTINKIATKTTAAGKTYLATAKTKSLTATLKDANGNVLANKKVTFTVNGKTYTATTNAKGVATVKLALTAAKTYTVTIKFAGDNVYAASTVSAKVKLNKEKTKLTAPKKTFKRAKKVKKVVITLKNSKGKAVAKKKITLTVNKKKYTAKTNKKGKATIKVKLTKKGTFKYKVKFAGDTQYKAAKKNGKIKIK
ncbi:MAG: Ig-like domain repeat protein, partial [Methanobrevibacter sp.]|uniref:Ig-like domain-containing protein n=1 Tax=Methanobrevibacter sp. TaxID=66852 RepID=UPI002E775FA5